MWEYHLQILSSMEANTIFGRNIQQDASSVLIIILNRADRAGNVVRLHLFAFHRCEEFFVGLGLLHAFQKEFDCSQVIHFVEYLSEDPNFLKFIL